MLLPPIHGMVFQVTHNKQNSVIPSSYRHGEIVFVLLYEVIILNMRLAPKYVWLARFQGPFLWFFVLGPFICIQNYLQDPLKVLFGILWNYIISGIRKWLISVWILSRRQVQFDSLVEIQGYVFEQKTSRNNDRRRSIMSLRDRYLGNGWYNHL